MAEAKITHFQTGACSRIRACYNLITRLLHLQGFRILFGLGQDPRICTADMFPGDAAAAGQGLVLRGPCCSVEDVDRVSKFPDS